MRYEGRMVRVRAELSLGGFWSYAERVRVMRVRGLRVMRVMRVVRGEYEGVAMRV